MGTKIAVLGNGQLRQASKALSFEQFRSMLAPQDGSTPSAVMAYKTSVWAFRAVQYRADTISGIPIVVMRNGEPVDKHPLADLFSDTTSDLIKRVEYALSIWGDNYLEITAPRLGSQRGLRWLNPLAVTPKVGAFGITSYQYAPQRGGAGTSFAPEDIVHLHTFNPNDDLSGWPALSVALVSVGVSRNLARHAQSFFGNGALLNGIVEIPGASNDDINTFEKKWKSVTRGVNNFFRTLFVGSEGIKYTPLGALPKDLAMPELAAEVRLEICGALGVPPILIGASEAANYATAKEQRESYYTDTVLPELDFIEDGLNNQFVSRFYPGMRIKFDTSGVGVLQENEKDRNTGITIAYKGGWMMLNEARARADLPPTPDGDTFAAPAAFGGSGLPDTFRREEYP